MSDSEVFENVLNIDKYIHLHRCYPIWDPAFKTSQYNAAWSISIRSGFTGGSQTRQVIENLFNAEGH